MDKENLVLEYKMQALRLDKQMHRLREETEEYKKAYDVSSLNLSIHILTTGIVNFVICDT